MLTILLLLSFIVYAIIYLVLKYTVYNYWEKRNVPCIKPSIIFGNVWEVITLRSTWSKFIQNMHNNCKGNKYMGIFVMLRPALIVRDLEIIKDILIKDFDHFQNNWFEADPKVDPLLARNPFVLRDKEWRETRNLFTPQLTTAKVKSMFPLIQETCKNLVNYIKVDNKGNCLEVADLSGRFTGDVVMSCGYGLEAKSFLKESPETFVIGGASAEIPGITITLKRTFALLFKTFSRIFNVTFFGYPTPKVFYDIITDAIKNRTKNNIVQNDFLNYLMELRSKQKIGHDLDILGHAFTFFLDSFQTAYSVMAYALLELSLNPQIQDAARNEIRMVCGKHNGVLSYEAYKELQYMENIVFETLRKIPAIKSMSKICTKTYVLHDPEKNTSVTIEKGTPVYFSVVAVHHDPQYFPDPQTFDPDRFTEEARQTRPKCSFLGFGDGPRICFGRKFALAQIVLGLASILQEFDLVLNKKTSFPVVHDSYHVSDVPVSGLYIDFIPRLEKE